MLGHVATSVGNALPGSTETLAAGLTEVLRVSSAQAGQFTVPVTGLYLLEAVGGGASGARTTTSTSGSSGPGFGFSVVYLRQGEVVDYVVGAGGASPVSSEMVGNRGGESSFTLPSGLRLRTIGGNVSPLGSTNFVNGGTAVGFDVRLSGGTGRTIDTGGPRRTPSAPIWGGEVKTASVVSTPGLSTPNNTTGYGANPGEVAIWRIG